ncbi:MAG: hypothetical protein MJ247_05635 [Alphaproteobacteria bacterium]|nr:hypothetical protein [Alphaproteobacteria bacterium]
MSVKFYKKLILGVMTAATTASCQSFYNNGVGEPAIVVPKAPSSVVICRSAQCGPARDSMTREYMYNALFNLFDTNLDSVVTLCEADPNTHACFENYIQFPITAGVAPATVVIDSAKLLTVNLLKNEQVINIALDYNMHYNSIRPVCRTTENQLFVKSADYVLLENTGSPCQFTTVATSQVSQVYAIDYVNLDYGEIGMQYSIGIAGHARGGGSGYMIMKFQKTAFPSAARKFVLPKQAPVVTNVNPNEKQKPGLDKTLNNQVTPGQYKVKPLPLK